MEIPNGYVQNAEIRPKYWIIWPRGRVGRPPCYRSPLEGDFRRIPGLGLRLVLTTCSIVSFVIVTFFVFCIGVGLIAFLAVSFYFLALRLALGLIVASVSGWRPVLVLPLAPGVLSRGGSVLTTI